MDHGELVRLSRLLDEALSYAKGKAKEYADAERDYRKAKAVAWQSAPAGTVPEREAWVQGECADARHKRDTADGLRQLGLEAIRSRRQQLSSWQTWANAERAEAEFARTGPNATP